MPAYLLVGALALALSQLGCPTVDLGETTEDPSACRPDPAYFRDIAWPEYFAPTDAARSCVGQSACHRLDDGRSALRFVTDPVDHNRNYDVVTRFLNCGSPEASSALTKPLAGVDPHGGGDLFPSGDNAETVFLEWFALE